MNSTTAKTDMTVANEINRQIGTRAFFMMGAQNKSGSSDSLSFKIRGSRQFTHIRIKLELDDTYTVTFYKIWGVRTLLEVAKPHVTVDILHQVISLNTGLALSL